MWQLWALLISPDGETPQAQVKAGKSNVTGSFYGCGTFCKYRIMLTMWSLHININQRSIKTPQGFDIAD